MNDEIEDLPSPPAGEVMAIDDEIDASLFTDVPKMGQPMPVGTYHFRLEKFAEKWTLKDKDGKELLDSEKQPYFELQWKCQQEPHTGRVVFENCPWVKPEDVKDANNLESPRRAEARKILNDRLPRSKEIMEAAGFLEQKDAGSRGKFGFKAFLGTNPELKLQLKIKEKQQKNQAGKYVGSGDWVNEVQKHVSLHRPM